MAETTPNLRELPKRQAYAQLRRETAAILEGQTDEITAMATLACLLYQGFGHLWAGFYRVVGPQLLRVGPYQGTLGCLEIPFGKGVCGTAAAGRATVVVPDVKAFPGHIACDSRSASEIVVPVFDTRGSLLGVLDIDSDRPAAFDAVDQEELEALVAWFRQPSPAR